MSNKDQESFMELHNKFDSTKRNWPKGMKQYFEEITCMINQMTLLNKSKEKAIKVVAINATNGFEFARRTFTGWPKK